MCLDRVIKISYISIFCLDKIIQFFYEIKFHLTIFIFNIQKFKSNLKNILDILKYLNLFKFELGQISIRIDSAKFWLGSIRPNFGLSHIGRFRPNFGWINSTKFSQV